MPYTGQKFFQVRYKIAGYILGMKSAVDEKNKITIHSVSIHHANVTDLLKLCEC